MAKHLNIRAYTLVETMVALAFAIILVTAVYNAYILTRQVYTNGVSGQSFQDGAHIVLSKIIQGGTESTGIFRLSEGVSYTIAAINELHFTGTDTIERWYHLNNTNTQLLYHHPNGAGNTDEIIYTAPAGSTITLRFWVPSGAVYSGVDVGIDVALTQNIGGRNISGAATTMVLLRNHP